MQRRSGTYKINFPGKEEYRSFVPAPLPPALTLDSECIDLLVKANRQLAVLDKMTELIPNINLFISMYVRKEALMSSQIEGTQCTLDDVLDPLIDANANQDVAEVINYVKATDFAIGRLAELPLCNRLIREIHAVLMQGEHGKGKSPGEFRHSQNWIGAAGSTLQTARFVPPELLDMHKALDDFEAYLNADDSLDFLVRAALIHYQFETVHPFLDGNGRVGRLIIILFLIQNRVLKQPALYISYFLKKNRIEYYDRLNEVRFKGNYEQWIKFFLEAVHGSASDAINAIERLAGLRNVNIATIRALKGKGVNNLLRLFEYLEANPIIDIAKTAAALELSFPSTSALVKKLCALGILQKSSGNMRNRAFSYEAYLEILRDGT